jgi:hypothetical protein
MSVTRWSPFPSSNPRAPWIVVIITIILIIAANASSTVSGVLSALANVATVTGGTSLAGYYCAHTCRLGRRRGHPLARQAGSA